MAEQPPWYFLRIIPMQQEQLIRKVKRTNIVDNNT